MSGVIRTYDPSKKIITFGGVPIQGFIDGDAVTVAPEADEFETVVGTDGEVTRSYQNNPIRTATVRLMASSTSNDYLSTQADLKRVAILYVADGSGTTEFEGPAWVARRPDRSLGRSVGENEWTFTMVSQTEVIGGNPADVVS